MSTSRGFVPGTHVLDGDNCPECGQFVKLYRRTLSHATARVMIALWQVNEGQRYVYIPDLFTTLNLPWGYSGDGTKGRYWGLMQQQPGFRDDGSNRIGWWRLTNRGRDFVTLRKTVPKYAHIYNNQCFGLSGPPWTIEQALGTRFNYAQLMAGHWPPPPRKRYIPRQP